MLADLYLRPSLRILLLLVTATHAHTAASSHTLVRSSVSLFFYLPTSILSLDFGNLPVSQEVITASLLTSRILLLRSVPQQLRAYDVYIMALPFSYLLRPQSNLLFFRF